MPIFVNLGAFCYAGMYICLTSIPFCICNADNLSFGFGCFLATDHRQRLRQIFIVEIGFGLLFHMYLFNSNAKQNHAKLHPNTDLDLHLIKSTTTRLI